MLTRWSIPEPVPSQIIAPEYNKEHRILNGDQLPARPGYLCILGPDYSCVNNMLHEHWMYGGDDDLLDAKLLEIEEKKAAREVIAEAKRQKRRDDTIERRKVEKLIKEERAKQNKLKGFTGKPSIRKIS